MKLIIPALAALTAAATGAQAATFTYVPDQDALADAVAPLSVEDFSDAVLVPGFSFVGPATSITDGALGAAVASNKVLVFTFADPIVGFGVDFDLTRNGVSTGLDVSVGLADGTHQTLAGIPMVANGYYGFTSDVGVKTVTFASGAGEAFALDNVAFGSTLNPSAAPEPTAWTMMITGFAGAGVMLRRRRALRAQPA